MVYNKKLLKSGESLYKPNIQVNYCKKHLLFYFYSKNRYTVLPVT